VKSIKPSPSDIAVLIYTSGTTGSPKGVLLSHGNFTSNVLAGAKLYPELGAEDRALSILPWAHSFGQTGELYCFIYVGGSIGFVENVTTIAEDMGKVKPTFLIAVPKIFNKIYAGLWAKMDEAGGLAKMLFTMGVESGRKTAGTGGGREILFSDGPEIQTGRRHCFQKDSRAVGRTG
jgi:long-chain acyl-CoA synthetase